MLARSKNIGMVNSIWIPPVRVRSLHLHILNLFHNRCKVPKILKSIFAPNELLRDEMRLEHQDEDLEWIANGKAKWLKVRCLKRIAIYSANVANWDILNNAFTELSAGSLILCLECCVAKTFTNLVLFTSFSSVGRSLFSSSEGTWWSDIRAWSEKKRARGYAQAAPWWVHGRFLCDHY